VEDMKKKEERMEKQMNEIMAENKRLTEPLQKAREQVEELRKQVRNAFEYIVAVNELLCRK
jgi:phage shock protein A